MNINILFENIFFQWFLWHFWQAPKAILKGWGTILAFNFANFFSIPLLFKTLFSYWHEYRWHYPKGLDIGKYLEVFFSNSISRIIGAIVRLIVIIAGIIAEIFIFLVGLTVLLFWFALPFMAFWCLWQGTKLLF